ncbi:hypothetical protein BJ085DRAFT_33739 [Dimargaris cristalligena]|uniref:Uncharacterized protein n=1 Tax=Dimargaris cristalligena TaxID=215637 RepID=A0A4P9ZZ59_9FUNG|nr:hypothetical protein BJ085DRAFT_33739 [Dimargaris cristalligena]|eukprot:RKP38688.1 hypothetical protein BJ085DRAFT_33739 [Dimargaris cristalligena]
MFFDTKNSASLSLTEDENLLIQESMSDLQMPNNVEVGSPTTRAVFTDASDWNGLDNATVSAHPTANSTASPEDEAKRPATYKDLERLFREADSIDQWSPLRPDPANRKSVTRTINSNYLEQFGTQPLEEETAVVHCEYCNKALSKKFLPRHIAKTCRKVDRSHSTTAASSQSTVVASGSQPSAASLLPAPSTEPGLILGEEELLHSGSITTLSGQVPTIVTNGKGKTTGLKTGEPKPKNKPRKMTKAQEKKAQKLAESAASTNSTEETLANTSEVLALVDVLIASGSQLHRTPPALPSFDLNLTIGYVQTVV